MLTAIIIDDEASSRNALRNKLAKYCTDVVVIAECENGEEGIRNIGKSRPDIVFLDVEMPRMNGFNMLQQLSEKDFEVIFITAYDQYAIKAIRYSALDYIVKPIEIEDLRNAVQRAVEKRSKAIPNARIELLLDNMVQERNKCKRIAVPATGGLQFIKINDIIYLEASVNYTIFHLSNNIKYLVSKTLKEYEDMLPLDIFIRIHNSHIINKNYVERYIRGEGGQVVLSNGSVLDISKRKKNEFLRSIGS
ncbi:MAG TPA: LytTR family DNA-binding domain-containing protein [Chitinophagaceae bacterium]|jgi:two-component system LytT family response regulator|nr:LytTR family DNA-binding domain-containing protein [Chitinophagaceae bacterium]